MNLIIAGSRGLEVSPEAVGFFIEKLGLKPTKIFSGVSGYVDLAGAAWAHLNGIEIREFPADWNQHGRAAGPIRNAEMAEADSDALLLLWDGKSAGSKNMKLQMTKRGKAVHEFINPPELIHFPFPRWLRGTHSWVGVKTKLAELEASRG